MNRERSESERQLLNDVLREEEGARQTALTAFRRARFIRKTARAGAVVALITLIAGLLLWQHNVTTNDRLVSRQPGQTITQRDLPTLTDQQLLASFPPNSCFLAEVDGRQILVFTDPAIEQQVLHQANSGFGKRDQAY